MIYMIKEELPKEDKILLEKYGRDALQIPRKYWDEFKEIEIIHKDYYDLFQNYYDDLKHYALMYRDVQLFADIWLHDMAFFAYKKDEIIGFMGRLLRDKSIKSKVVQLYYAYEPMFQDFCYNCLKIEKWERYSKKCYYDYKCYTQIKNKEFGERFCINKLTDKQCQIIIDNLDIITTSQSSINWGIPTFLNTPNKFVEEFYIPCFFSKLPKWNFMKKNILNYIYEYFPTINVDYIFNLHRPKASRALFIKEFDYFRNYSLYTGKDIEVLKAGIPKYLSYPQKKMNIHLSCQLPNESYDEYKRRKEWERINDIEKENQYREECRIIDIENEKIREFSKKIYAQIDLLKKQRHIELVNEYSALIKEIGNSLLNCQAWLYIYKNPNDLNEYLTNKYNKFFRNFWMQDSNSCRAFYRSHRGYSGLVEKFIELDKFKIRYIDSDEYTNFHNKPFELENINRWIRTVKIHEEREEGLRIKEYKRKAELERLEYERRMEKYRFNKRNFHERDKNITFRPIDHVYIVNGIALDSVTTFVNNAFPKFNSEFHAKRKAKQLGISPEEVLEMWDKKGKESRDLGTAMHSKIENYYLGSDSVETDAYKLFKIFANKIELKPYRTEWAVYDWEHKIAGTIDFVDYQNGEYIIYDWKRSEKIIDNGIPVKINKYGEKGNYPLEHLDNTPYYHYALQLSLYKYILEKNYGMKISDLRLGIFHPTYNKPYVLKMPYLKKEINDIFNLRSEVIF